jgi:Macroglobulin domain MG4
VQSRTPFKVTVRVKDTRGFVVRNARVFILGVPYSRVGHVDPQTTSADGTVTLTVNPLAGLELGRGKYLVFFVRATAPNDKELAGVSTRRLVQLRTGPSA